MLERRSAIAAVLRSRSRSSSHLLDDPRPAHLDDDLAAVRRAAPRGSARSRRSRAASRRSRRSASSPISRVDRLARAGANGSARHVVDELAELLDVDVGQQVGARREELPELDERRAELLERTRGSARRLRASPASRRRPRPRGARAAGGRARDARHFERARNLALVGHTDVVPSSPGCKRHSPLAESARAERLDALTLDEPATARPSMRRTRPTRTASRRPSWIRRRIVSGWTPSRSATSRTL